MTTEDGKAPKIVLLESEIEAAAGRVAERALNEAWAGASNLFGDVFGGLVGDRIKQWRTRNLVDSLVKTRDHLAKQGIPIENAKSLPAGEVFAIFEGASRTDDIDLRHMWSALLSNGMNPVKDAFIDPSFPRLLQNLSGLDARLLRCIESHQTALADARRRASKVWEGVNSDLNWQSSPEYKKRTEEVRSIAEEFDIKSRELLTEITDTYSADHISYSVSSLLRSDLLDTTDNILVDRQLVNLRSGPHGERLIADTTSLHKVLKKIQLRLERGFEVGKNLSTSTSGSPLVNGHQALAYALTDYARRFLAACT